MKTLSLRLNMARQTQITNEIAEISGSGASQKAFSENEEEEEKPSMDENTSQAVISGISGPVLTVKYPENEEYKLHDLLVDFRLGLG